MFDLYLRRSESNKPKPMRQVLLTLMSLRSKNPDQGVQICETEYASRKAVELISDEVECSSAKPAFQVLEHFLSKAILTASEIVTLVMGDQSTRTIQRSQTVTYSTHDVFPPEKSDPVWASQVRRFISDILSWIRYPDTAAAAGRLISILVKSLQSGSHEDTNDATSQLSMCMDLVKKALKEHPDLLNAIRNHVLPGLFRLEPKDTLGLLQSMPLFELSQGNIGKLSDADIEVCLVSVEVAEGFGFLPNLGVSKNNSILAAAGYPKLIVAIRSNRSGEPGKVFPI